MNALGEQLKRPALVLVALVLSAHAALSATTLGDYPDDGGPALAALLHGDLHAFGQAHPAMGALSLLVRAPFAAIAYIGHPSVENIYRWGVLPCVMSVGVLALWLTELARRQGTGALGQWTILLVALLNPLITSAVSLGHPEELMTAALCIGALVAAFERRQLLSIVLLGLALACKQWTVVAILPVLLVLERGRLRALAGSLAVAVVVTLPEFLGSPASYLHNQIFLAQEQGPAPASLSWWWLLVPSVTKHVFVEGRTVAFTGHRLSRALVHLVHPLMIATDLLLAAIVARVARLPLRRDQAFALMGVVLLLRCAMDTETMPYYHMALFLDLLAWDALSGVRIPTRALAAAGLSYLLFDRLTPSAIGTAPSSLLYGGSAVIVLILLGWALVGGRSAAPRAIELRRPLSA
jgi:hypothetical protein